MYICIYDQLHAFILETSTSDLVNRSLKKSLHNLEAFNIVLLSMSLIQHLIDSTMDNQNNREDMDLPNIKLLMKLEEQDRI